jgi:hypothetical protein
LNAALQELEANSSRLKREDILASFFNKFEVLFEIFANQGIFVSLYPPFLLAIWAYAHVDVQGFFLLLILFLCDKFPLS